MSKERHYCPACRSGLGTDPIKAPLRCTHCGWHLITLKAWRKLPAFGQGYALYMQSNWPTSELKGAKNPYAEGTAEWKAFCEGEHRAALDAQDGEE